MKKLFLFVISFFISFSIWAERNPLIIKTYKVNTNEISIKRRTPANFPIYAYYDDETNQIEVEGPDHMTGEVFLYDEAGMPLGYSSSLNTVFDLPDNFHGLVLIEWIGEDWDANGGIEV